MKDRVVVPDKQNGSLNVFPELDVFVSDVRLDIYEYIMIINKLDGFVDFGFTCEEVCWMMIILLCQFTLQ